MRDAYLPPSSLLKSGHLDKAAIISLDGSSTWATSSGFTVNIPSPFEGPLQHPLPTYYRILTWFFVPPRLDLP